MGDASPGGVAAGLVLLVSGETLGVSSEERHDSDLPIKGSPWLLCRDERSGQQGGHKERQCETVGTGGVVTSKVMGTD